VGNTPGPSSSLQEDGFFAPSSQPSDFQLQRDPSPSEETGWGQPAAENGSTTQLPARSPGKQLGTPPGFPSKLPASPTAPPGFPAKPQFRAGPPGFEGPPNPRTPRTDAPRPNRAAGKAKPTLDEIYAKVSVAPKVEGATGWDAPIELPEDEGPFSGPEQTTGWSAASTDELPAPTNGLSLSAWHTNLDSRAPSYQPKTQPAVQTNGGLAEHSDFAGFPLLDDGPLLQNPAVRSSLNGNARAYQPQMRPESPLPKFVQHDVRIPEPYNPILEQGRPRVPRPVRPQLPDLPEGCISAARFFPSPVDTALSSTQRGGAGRMLMTALKNAVANAGNGSGPGGREDGEGGGPGVGRKYAPPLREAKRPTEGTATQERWVHDKWEELEGRGTNRGGLGKPRGAYMPFSKAPARQSAPTERFFEPKVDDGDPLAEKWGGFAGKEEAGGQDGGGIKNWDTDSDDEEKRGGGQQLAGGNQTQLGGPGSRRPRFGGCERLDIEGKASP
jgi:hypothetical protein